MPSFSDKEGNRDAAPKVRHNICNGSAQSSYHRLHHVTNRYGSPSALTEQVEPWTEHRKTEKKTNNLDEQAAQRDR